ncbi:MAG: WbqC family protein [bacterium]
MILAIHQPNYLPWLGFFHKIWMCDTFVLLDNARYSRGSWMNRVKVKIASGPIWLSVPIITKSKCDQSIIDAKIQNNEPWRRKHWHTLIQNYSGSPFFRNYKSFFSEFYRRKWSKLSEMNEFAIRYIASELGLRRELIRASDLKVEGSGTELLINICKALGADTYLSGDGAGGYLEEGKFAESGIELIYQNFKHPAYKQLYGDFVAGLSIVDLLFNHGPDSLGILTGEVKIGEMV